MSHSLFLRRTLVITLLVVSAATASFAQKPSKPLYKDSSKPIEVRVKDLLSKMTLKEKIGQMNLVTYVNENNTTNKVDDKVRRSEVGSILKSNGVKQNLYIQKIAVEQTRLGIPVIFQEDVIHGYKTIFPMPLAEAASWNLEGIQKTAAVAAKEAAAGGIRLTYAPMVDIARDPRWGRIVEGAGEDPYYGSLVAAARVKGFQGNDLKSINSLMSCVKHFAGYGEALAGRDYNISDFSERALRETYLLPFKAAIDAGVQSVMTAYSGVDGIPATANQKLMKDILRKELGFKGMLITDWETVKNLVKIGVAATNEDAVKQAVDAGVDVDMTSEFFITHLEKLVKSGAVKEAVIDTAVRRILTAKFLLGLFDDPYKYLDANREKETLLHKDHLALARQAARESMVLLKNNGVLPLKKDIKTIAVIGPLAARKKDMLGWWGGTYSQGKAEDVTSFLDAISLAVSPSTQVIYAEGVKLDRFAPKGVELIPEAVEAAKKADIVLLAVGEEYWMSGEGGSISEITLPGAQEQLINAIAETGKPIVSVLFNGRPFDIRNLVAKSTAVLEAWFPGTTGGLGVADVLFGDYNPGGKLTVTFPLNTGQIPIYYNYRRTSHDFEGVNMTNRFLNNYLDIPTKPLFPFGFGLSYTTFNYADLNVSSANNGGNITATFTLTNTGKVAGTEVAQLYIRDKVSSVARNVKDLKGFARVQLQPGETKTVTIRLDKNALSFLNKDLKRVVEPGEFDIMIGSSSEDIHLKKVFILK